ncbi:MAG: ATP-binding cassette domain-containing protein, partial [Elusimicrobia bacterium]|nr:ATP-binding cassette domain-containing protein [Elusimicrobiota bacterium]
GYDWSVREAMEFVCAARGVDAGRISDVLKSCGLEGEERKPVPALSGGLKQRLALAQALVGDPPVLVLDEPCSSLDLKSRREFLGLLGRLKARKTVLLTSHRLEEAELLADRVVLMSAGQEPREVAPEALSSHVAPAGRRLRLRLETPESVSRALTALERSGFAPTACERGGGLWVVQNGGGMLEPVRLLEALGIRVHEVGRESEGA